MSRYSSGSSTLHNSQGLEFYQNELEAKNELILLWQKRYEEERNQAKQIKIELSVAKAYIDTLSTKQEVVQLKNRVSSLEEEKAQLTYDYVTLKTENSELTNTIVKLRRDIENLQSKLDNQTLETEAFKSIIKLWESRRKAAKESGKLTAEDILAEKLKIQDQFDELLKIATCREQYFKAKIEAMKLKVEDSQKAERETKQGGILLMQRIDFLQKQIEEQNLKINDLLNQHKATYATQKTLEEKNSYLEAKEKQRLSTQTKIQYCLENIALCKKATERMILFIRSALDGKFVDPSLIFSLDDEPSHPDFHHNEILPEDDLERLAEKCLQETNELRKKVDFCRNSLTDKYVSQLSNEVNDNCHIQ